MQYKIEFWGDTGRVHNARFTGGSYTNEVLIGLFYEDTDFILNEIEAANGSASSSEYEEIDIGDFITGRIAEGYITITPDHEYVQSKTYRVKISDLQEALKKWEVFKSHNRNGQVKSVSITGSHE